MQIIPNLPVIQEDELLISYLFRVAVANGRNAQLSSIDWFFSFKGTEFGDSVFNLAENLNIDPISLFRKTTLFNYYQLLMTRKQVKTAINHIFNHSSKNHNNYFYYTAPVHEKEIYFCPDCMIEDTENHGFKYIHRDHQLLGFCFKHHRPLETLTPQQFFSTPVPRQKRPLPEAKDYETSFSRRVYSTIRYIQQNDIVINYDDTVAIVDEKFNPNHFFTMENFTSLEQKADKFVSLNFIEQDKFLGEFFLYFQRVKDKGFSLADYPFVLLAMLAYCVRSPLDIKLLLKHFEKDEFWLQLLLKSSASGLEIESTSEGSLLKVKDLRTQISKVVSAYSILDL